MIPFKIKEAIGSFEMKDLTSISEKKYKKIFADNNLHRFNDVMASLFYNAVQRIHTVYHDDASEIWKDKSESVEVVYRFLEFDGRSRFLVPEVKSGAEDPKAVGEDLLK